MEREAGEVDPPTERDRKCADETGDPVAPDLGVGEDLKMYAGKDSSVVCSPINDILHGKIHMILFINRAQIYSTVLKEWTTKQTHN